MIRESSSARRVPSYLSFLLVPLIVVSGCAPKSEAPSGGPSTTSKPGKPEARNTILIGHYASMTGSEATFGQSTDNGIKLAVKERNAAGGIKGKQIELKTYDTQGKSQEAGTAVTRFITSDKVTALIGEVASSLSIAGGRVAQQYGVPMITPSSTNPEVTKIGDMIFRVCFIDSFQGYVEAKFAKDNLKAKKVAILYDQAQAYSKGLKDYFKSAFTSMGGVVPTEQAYTGGDQDFSAQLTTIRGTNPDVIFVPGYYTDAGNIALQARKLGIKVPLLGGDGWDSAKLAEIGGEAVEGSYFSNHYAIQDPRPEVQDFLTKYKADFLVVPDALAALGYDAARVLFAAMDQAPSLEGKDLAKAIAETKDFPGVTGKIAFDANRDAKKSAVVVQIKGGIPVFAATVEPPQ